MKILLQIGVVFSICLAAELLSAVLPIPLPGSIISLILLFLLLLFKIMKVDHIRQKADFLLKNMAFFFIPAGIGILKDFDKIKDSIVPLLVVVCLTTLLTFGSTALVVQGIIALQDKRAKKKKRPEVRNE